MASAAQGAGVCQAAGGGGSREGAGRPCLERVGTLPTSHFPDAPNPQRWGWGGRGSGGTDVLGNEKQRTRQPGFLIFHRDHRVPGTVGHKRSTFGCAPGTGEMRVSEGACLPWTPAHDRQDRGTADLGLTPGHEPNPRQREAHGTYCALTAYRGVLRAPLLFHTATGGRGVGRLTDGETDTQGSPDHAGKGRETQSPAPGGPNSKLLTH